MPEPNRRATPGRNLEVPPTLDAPTRKLDPALARQLGIGSASAARPSVRLRLPIALVTGALIAGALLYAIGIMERRRPVDALRRDRPAIDAVGPKGAGVAAGSPGAAAARASRGADTEAPRAAPTAKRGAHADAPHGARHVSGTRDAGAHRDIATPGPPEATTHPEAKGAANALLAGRLDEALTHYRQLAARPSAHPAYGLIARLIARERTKRCIANGARPCVTP